MELLDFYVYVVVLDKTTIKDFYKCFNWVMSRLNTHNVAGGYVDGDRMQLKLFFTQHDYFVDRY